MNETNDVCGDPLIWARDFAVLGLATGGLAPFFVIFDPFFTVVGGLVGAVGGGLLGALACWATERLRPRVPLAVLLAGMAAVGSLWGAVAGACGGLVSLHFGPIAGIPMGFIVGGCTGMVQLALFFGPYLFLSVRKDATWPLVIGAVLLSPFMGWLGLAALGFSTFGLWLFALPFALWAGIRLERARETQAAPSSLDAHTRAMRHLQRLRTPA